MRKMMLKWMTLFLTTLFALATEAEHSNLYAPYGLGAPISIAGEPSYGLEASYQTGGIGTTHGFVATPVNGLSNGYDYEASSLGYGTNGYGYGTNSYPAINSYGSVGYGVHTHHGPSSYSSFNQHEQPHYSGIYAGANLGGKFYTGSRFLGSGYGGYKSKHPYSFGNGLSNYGVHATSDIGHNIGVGSPLARGYIGLAGHTDGSIGYAGNYGSEYGYGVHQPFK